MLRPFLLATAAAAFAPAVLAQPAPAAQPSGSAQRPSPPAGRAVLDTFKDEVVIDTPVLRDRITRTGLGGRNLFIDLTYSFSEGPPRRGQREPGFEFEAGAVGPPQ